MKKNLLFRQVMALLTALFFSQLLLADPVDPNTAANVGKHFYQSTRKGQAMADNVTLSLAYQSGPNENNLLFIFNINTDAGFVIVAADDAVTPILGYSDEGAFNADDMPEALQKWLDGYEAQIFYVRENKLKADDKIQSTWTSLRNGIPALAEASGVAPLLETKWNQNPNENMFCPGGSVTGCTATAMAQVMYYWKYPVQGQGFHMYVENNYGALWADFGSTVYQWGTMPWHPTSPSPQISRLMLHCGISVDMDYSPSGSGAPTSSVANALIKYFKYDPNTVVFNDRKFFSDAAWITMLKQELDASRPMQYKGTGTAGGHSFVCDGYDDTGLFHFNWGWGGSSDGYFTINALNPGTLGTGGGAGGFNAGQGAVMGIQPDPTVKPGLQMTANLFVPPIVPLGSSILVNASFANTGAQPFAGFVTLAVYDQQDNLMGVSLSQPDEYFNIGGAGALISNESFSFQSLPPGQYTASLVYRVDDNTGWTKIQDTQFSNAVAFTILSATDIYLFEVPILSTETVMQNEPFSLTASLQNFGSGGTIVYNVTADLHNLDGTWNIQITELPNVVIIPGTPTNTLTFNSAGLNVSPGTYRIVIWAAPIGTQAYQKVNVPSGANAITFLTVLPPPPAPDQYEPNNTQNTAKLMPLNFAGNTALVSTFGSDNHNPDDEDYYKIVLPADPNFHYSITGRLQDSYNNTNGFTYTNDCFWRYNDGSGWSTEFDDDLLTPGMNFLVPAGQTVTFFVKPYYAGSSGSYLLDLAVTKIPVLANDDPCNAISLPVNGIPQTGFSNQNATATPFEFNLAPAAGSCLASWCDTETGARVKHAMWFKFLAPFNGAVEVSTCGLADFDTQIAMFSVGNCNNSATYSLVTANDDGDGCSGFTSELATGIAIGQTYYILVDGYEDATGNLGIKITNLQASAVQNLAADADLLTVSPNPTSGLLHVKFNGQDAMDALMLRDLNGKILFENQFGTAQQETDVNLDVLPNGLYLLQLRSGENVFTQKVMVQR